MKLSYDHDVDGLMVRFADGEYSESEEVRPGITLDFDAEGRVIGLEVLPASKLLAAGDWSIATVRRKGLDAAE